VVRTDKSVPDVAHVCRAFVLTKSERLDKFSLSHASATVMQGESLVRGFAFASRENECPELFELFA
jgi:hypothetical protein